MNIEKIYDNETQKLIDSSINTLNDYSDFLSRRLAVKVDSKEITYKQASDAFHGDATRNAMAKSCADIVAMSIPTKIIAREV